MFQSLVRNFLIRRNLAALTPRAALVDMDGTLYDSMQNHATAWYQLMNELGVKCDRDEFFLYEGRTGRSTINLLFNRELGRDATPEEVEKYYHRKTELFNLLPPPGPMPGAAEILSLFKEVGMKIVLVTGSGQHSLIDRLTTDFPGIFTPELMVTAADVTHGKPHPEPYIRAMQKAGVRPSMSIALENAPLGVESAVRAGVFTVAVTTGPIPRKAFEEVDASVIFNSMPEAARDMPTLLLAMLATHVDK